MNSTPNSAQRKGYSGTAIATRVSPLAVHYGLGLAEHDTEGRVITAEFPDFFLVDVYTPNSGAELLRLDYRQQWDLAFYDFLKKLEADKPVLVCGDMNVAHTDIDLAHPAANYNKAAGYMQAEIDGMDRYLAGGAGGYFPVFLSRQAQRVFLVELSGRGPEPERGLENRLFPGFACIYAPDQGGVYPAAGSRQRPLPGGCGGGVSRPYFSDISLFPASKWRRKGFVLSFFVFFPEKMAVFCLGTGFASK